MSETTGDMQVINGVEVTTIDAAKGVMQVTDANGRKLQFARLTELERFDFYEIFGAQQPNAYAMAMAGIAATLRAHEKDGTMVPRPRPTKKESIRECIRILGEAGMNVLSKALMPPEPKEGEEEGEHTNADAEPLALAKN